MAKKKWLILAVISFGCLQASAQTGRQVEGDRLVMVDGKGTTRGFIGLTGGDQSFTVLSLSDTSGRPRFRITVYPDQRPPVVEVIDTRGKSSALGKASGKQIRLVPADGKADAAMKTDVDFLQDQIDQMRNSLNEVIEEMNRR